jgi:hypothetical protein
MRDKLDFVFSMTLGAGTWRDILHYKCWHYLIGLMCITWGMWGGDSISRSTWHWEEVKFSCIWFFVKVLGFFKF